MEEIKTCPFCGEIPVLKHEIHLYKDNSMNVPCHDLEVEWEITCLKCGVSQKSFGRTFCRIGKDGQIKIVPQSYEKKEQENPADKRLEVIAKWNERH